MSDLTYTTLGAGVLFSASVSYVSYKFGRYMLNLETTKDQNEYENYTPIKIKTR